MKNTSNSPFVFDVSDPMRSGMVEHRTQTGPSPTRIGPEMIAIPEGHDVTVDATLTPLGEAIMVDATIQARLQGECVRCLKTITPDTTLTVSQVFATTPDFVVGDPDDTTWLTYCKASSTRPASPYRSTRYAPTGVPTTRRYPASTTSMTGPPIPTTPTIPIVGRLAPLIHVGRVWRNSYEP